MDRLPSRWRNALPTNVWLGVSVESPEYYWRVDVLRDLPAHVRFLSVEPLLAAVPHLQRFEPGVESALLLIE